MPDFEVGLLTIRSGTRLVRIVADDSLTARNLIQAECDGGQCDCSPEACADQGQPVKCRCARCGEGYQTPSSTGLLGHLDHERDRARDEPSHHARGRTLERRHAERDQRIQGISGLRQWNGALQRIVGGSLEARWRLVGGRWSASARRRCDEGGRRRRASPNVYTLVT
jgi:hypothetical protein